MTTRKLAAIHPDEVLLLDFLKPLGISVYRLARDKGISQQQYERIIRGTRGVIADVAPRLARCLGTSARLWMGLQAQL
jgi:addiction module HigA family antidote